MGATKYPILAGSIIEIELPNDLQISDGKESALKSSTRGVADLSSKFEILGPRKVLVKDAFVQKSAPNGQDYRQDSFSVMIAMIVSPRTTAPTLSFKAKITTAGGFLQYTKLQGVYSNVYQARPFQNAVLKRSNETNGDSSGLYNFTLQLSSAVNANEYIKIRPPVGVVINPGGSG
jgi:hypothetical protein